MHGGHFIVGVTAATNAQHSICGLLTGCISRRTMWHHRKAHPKDLIAAGVLVPVESASTMLSASPVSEDAALLVGGSTCIAMRYDERQSEYEATSLTSTCDDA